MRQGQCRCLQVIVAPVILSRAKDLCILLAAPNPGAERQARTDAAYFRNTTLVAPPRKWFRRTARGSTAHFIVDCSPRDRITLYNIYYLQDNI
jgi:hypothetical protein